MVAVKREASVALDPPLEKRTKVVAKSEAKATEGREQEATASEGLVVPTSAMVVRTVVRESHNDEIRKIVYNRNLCGRGDAPTEGNNLFATVGGNRATIYNGRHFGEYVGLVVHYAHENEDTKAPIALRTCAWLDARNHTNHPKGDAHLAIADAEGAIYVISATDSAVTHKLEGHAKGVVQLATCPCHSGHLLSLAKDGMVKLWSVYEEKCLATYEVGNGIQSLAWSPSGDWFLVGTSQGMLQKWHVDLQAAKSQSLKPMVVKKSGTGSKSWEKLCLEGCTHTDCVDDVKFVDDHRILTKSSDGRIFLSDLEEKKRMKSWKVPSSGGSIKCTSDVDLTKDGKYFVVGNSYGAVYVFAIDGESESHAAKLEPYKFQKAVQSCAISDDYKDIICTLGDGFLYRYRHFTPKAKTEEEAVKKDEEKEKE